MPSLRWTKLSLNSASPKAVAALQRSSNALAVVGSKAYVYGGELTPRTPVDDELWVVDLEDGTVSAAPSSGAKPSPRVGSAITSPSPSLLHMWGGREGVDMTPCDASLWTYDLGSSSWSSSPLSKGSEDVPDRSYHVLTSLAGKTYLHAGCPAKGRVGDLHAIATSEGSSAAAESWTTLPSAPGPGRGGTVLCPITLNGKSLLIRYGGFAGYELGSTLDVFDVETSTWTSTPMPGREGDKGHPLARSVHALVPVTPAIPTSDGEIVAAMVFGERGPAPAHLGHMGAGAFHQDAFAVLHKGSEVTAENPYGLVFEELEQNGEDGTPEPRGWFAAGWKGGREGKLVVQGGLVDSNDRLGDLWLGEIAA